MLEWTAKEHEHQPTKYIMAIAYILIAATKKQLLMAVLSSYTIVFALFYATCALLYKHNVLLMNISKQN